MPEDDLDQPESKVSTRNKLVWYILIGMGVALAAMMVLSAAGATTGNIFSNVLCCSL